MNSGKDSEDIFANLASSQKGKYVYKPFHKPYEFMQIVRLQRFWRKYVRIMQNKKNLKKTLLKVL